MILKHGLLGLVLVGLFAGLAAPVVAGSGWLLLVPPEVPGHGEGGTKFEVHAPLARWRQVQAFDTARECEGLLNDIRVTELRQVENLFHTPPYPWSPKQEAKPEPTQRSLTLEERIRAIPVLDLTDPVNKEKLERWEREVKRVEAAREPKQREINKRYSLWKCVPADAVYRAPK